MNNSDSIKLVFTYSLAAIVIIGGGAMLFISRGEQDSTDFALVAAGFIGAAIQFLFGDQQSTRASRAAQAQTETTVNALTGNGQ